MSKPTKPKTKAQIERGKLITLIHVAKNELALDDSTYRAVIKNSTGKESSKDCTNPQLRKVLDALKTKGFSVTPKEKKPDVVDVNQPMIDKIGALLADGNYSWAYADGIAKNMFGMEKLRFCTGKELHAIIAALTYNKNRLATKA